MLVNNLEASEGTVKTTCHHHHHHHHHHYYYYYNYHYYYYYFIISIVPVTLTSWQVLYNHHHHHSFLLYCYVFTFIVLLRLCCMLHCVICAVKKPLTWRMSDRRPSLPARLGPANQSSSLNQGLLSLFLSTSIAPLGCCC